MKYKNTSSAVSLRDICKVFPGGAGVQGINLDIEQGEFVTLLGPSGCGKTTTLNMVGGFLQPDSGAIFLGEQSVAGLPPYKRGIGFVFQDYALFPHMNVDENVSFGLRMRGVSRTEIAEQVRGALDMVHLQGRGDSRPAGLSGGQKQRVALARALVTRPNVLLLDEPLSSLDLKLREEMRLEIASLQRKLGISTILVSHDQGEALAVSDRTAVMKNGKIEQIGTPREIYEKPATQFVAEFIGTMNFVSGTCFSRASSSVEVNDQRRPVRLVGKIEDREKVRLAFRPERARLISSKDEKDTSSFLFKGKIIKRIYLGNIINTYIDTELGDSIVIEENNTIDKNFNFSDDSINIAVNGKDCSAFLDIGE